MLYSCDSGIPKHETLAPEHSSKLLPPTTALQAPSRASYSGRLLMADLAEASATLGENAPLSYAEGNRRIFELPDLPELLPNNYAPRSSSLRPEHKPIDPASTGLRSVSSHRNTLSSDYRSLYDPKPQNVLRRRPPTIGKHVNRSERRVETPVAARLSAVTPDSITDQAMDMTPRISCDYEEFKNRALLQSSSGSCAWLKMKAGERQAVYKPKELASFRTAITQISSPITSSAPTPGSPSTLYSGSPGIWSRTSISPHSLRDAHSATAGQHSKEPSFSQMRAQGFSSPIVSDSQSHHLDSTGTVFTSHKELKSNFSLLKPEDGGLSRTMGSTAASQLLNSKCRGLPIEPDNPRLSTGSFDTNARRMDKARKRISGLPELVEQKTTNLALVSRRAPVRPSREDIQPLELELEPRPIILSSLTPLSVNGYKQRECAESPSVSEIQRKKLSWKLAKADGKSKCIRLFPTRLRAKKCLEIADLVQDEIATEFSHGGSRKCGKLKEKSNARSHGDEKSTGLLGEMGVDTNSQANKRSEPYLNTSVLQQDRPKPVIANDGSPDGTVLAKPWGQERGTEASIVHINDGKHFKIPRSTSCPPSSVAPPPRTIGQQMRMNSSTRFSVLQRQNRGKQGRLPNGGCTSGWSHILNRKSSNVTNEFTSSCFPAHSDGSSIAVLPQAIKDSQSLDHMQSTAASVYRREPGRRGEVPRWNLLQKSYSSDLNIPSALADANFTPVTVLPRQATRSVAHYALLYTDMEATDDVLRHVEEVSPDRDEGGDVGSDTKMTHEPVLPPSPPQMIPELFTGQSLPSGTSPEKNASCTLNKETQDKRQSRLESVGRIPPVISNHRIGDKPTQISSSRLLCALGSPAASGSTVGQCVYSENTELNVHEDPLTKQTYNFTSLPKHSLQTGARDRLSSLYHSGEVQNAPQEISSQQSSCSGYREQPTAVGAVTKYETDEIWEEYEGLIDEFFLEGLKPNRLCRINYVDDADMTEMTSDTQQAELNHKAGPAL